MMQCICGKIFKLIKYDNIIKKMIYILYNIPYFYDTTHNLQINSRTLTVRLVGFTRTFEVRVESLKYRK